MVRVTYKCIVIERVVSRLEPALFSVRVKFSRGGDNVSYKAHWVGLLSIAHTENNRIPYDPVWIKRRCIFNSPVKLDVFIELGLIEILDNKSVSVSEQKSPIGSIGRVEESSYPSGKW